MNNIEKLTANVNALATLYSRNDGASRLCNQNNVSNLCNENLCWRDGCKLVRDIVKESNLISQASR